MSSTTLPEAISLTKHKIAERLSAPAVSRFSPISRLSWSKPSPR